MSSDEILVNKSSGVLRVTFNRPERHNAMSWAMWDGLLEACDQADRNDDVRVMVLIGAGDRAFVAGTDISQFADFGDGEDGVAYTRKTSKATERLERVSVPTVAAVQGFCVGAGLALAASCDLRVATRSSRFGVPIARTLGNSLSMNIYSLLVSQLGQARTLDLLLRARLLTAEEADSAGLLSALCEDGELESCLEGVVAPLLGHAPLSMWAAKEAVRRIRLAQVPDGDDITRRVFGSEDFHTGVRSFIAKEKPQWSGR